MSVVDVVGKGLVADARARRDQIRKRQERYANRAAAAQLIVPVAGRIIEENLVQKAQDFFNQENVLNLKREHAKAVREASSLFATRDAMAAADQTDEEFYYQKMRPAIAERMIAEAEQEEQARGINILGRHVETGDITNKTFIGTIDREARAVARERAANFREAIGAAEQIVSSEQFDSMLASKLKDATPTNIVDGAARKIRQIFGGKSTEEIQAQAIADVRNHYFMDDAKALNAFNQRLEQGRDVHNSVEYAELVKEIEEYEPRETRVIYDHKIVTKPDNSTVMVRTETPVLADGRTGPTRLATDTRGGVEAIPGLGAELTESQKLSQLSSARAGFDIVADGTRMVGAKVFKEEFVDGYLARMNIKKENGVDDLLPSNAQNLDDYNTMLGAWNDWISNNTDKIIDPDVKAMEREWMLVGRQLLSSSLAVQEMQDNLMVADTPHGKGIENVIGREDFQAVQRYIEAGYLDPQRASTLEKPPELETYRSLAEQVYDYKVVVEGFLNMSRFRYEKLFEGQ